MIRFRDFTAFSVAVSFIIGGALSRLLPHPPNFTSINAIALFGGMIFERRRVSIGVVLGAMLLSDLILGFHGTLLFVYLSFIFTIELGHRCSSSRSGFRPPIFLLISSFLFFFVTNFGVWLSSSLYPKTREGLEFCYFAGLPFLQNQILGDLFYGAVIFGGYASIERWVPAMRSLAMKRVKGII